jgi:glyoxylase I family protein
MRIKLTSVIVDDQTKAVDFYTRVLGFRVQQDFPAGGYRWITVSSPEGPDDLWLSLEPNAHPAARTYQEAMLAQGIPLAAFEVTDIETECKRLEQHEVAFTQKPVQSGPVKIAIFADTCGNLIQLYQPTG